MQLNSHCDTSKGGMWDEIERGASAFIAGAIAHLAAIHRVAQSSGALQSSGVSRAAMRAVHGAFARWRLGTAASLPSRSFYPQVEYPVLTVSVHFTGSTAISTHVIDVG